MKQIFIVAFFATILSSNLFSAEQSAFGAGNLDSEKPYGLTSSEQVILQNKKNLKKIVVSSNNQANEVDSLRERIDGLQSVIESLSRKSQENKFNLKDLSEKNSAELVNTNEYEKRIVEITQRNAQEIVDMKTVITELSNLLNNINSTYISKSEFNTLVGDFNKFKQLVGQELKKGSSSKKSKSTKLSGAEIAKLARSNYDKKRYTKSIEYYTQLIDKNYKPARAHYMIGEMKYYRSDYAEAIAYFKKSATLYSKASYMPTLMLHTAVAMQKTGDKAKAKSFYMGIVSKYPESTQATTAKSKLSKMK